MLLSFSRLGWLFIHYKRCMYIYREGRRSASSSSSRLLLPQPGQQMYNFFSPPPRCWDYYYCVPAWQQQKRPFAFRSFCVICECDVDVDVVALRARRFEKKTVRQIRPPSLSSSFTPPQIIFPTRDKLLQLFISGVRGRPLKWLDPWHFAPAFCCTSTPTHSGEKGNGALWKLLRTT